MKWSQLLLGSSPCSAGPRTQARGCEGSQSCILMLNAVITCHLWYPVLKDTAEVEEPDIVPASGVRVSWRIFICQPDRDCGEELAFLS